jgi:8-oxo-dGTP pyrophosphatase MutT (NUDIX family)
MRPVRNSAKAVIVEDGRLLALKMNDEAGVYYILPGGGQDPGEILTEAVRRECREEVGADVRVGELIWLREYIGRNHEFPEHDEDFHQVEFMFACTLVPGATLGTGHLLDERQVGIEWLPLATIEQVRLYPAALRPLLARMAGTIETPIVASVYLGDVN